MALLRIFRILKQRKSNKDFIMTFTQILEKIKASSEDNLFSKRERKKGTFFEKLAKVFLATDERYNKIFGNVKLWSELNVVNRPAVPLLVA